MASASDQANIADWYAAGRSHVAVVALGIALVLAACGESPSDANPTSQPPATEQSTTSVGSVPTPGSPAEGATVTPGADGIPEPGLAVSKSDVSGLPDSMLTAGEVLFFPEERAADLAETAGFDPLDIDGMRHAFFQLSEPRLVELAGTAAVIGASGRFPLDIPAGQYVVCLADSFVDHTAGPPYSVVGCDLVDLPNDASLTVSFGEGGVEAALD